MLFFPVSQETFLVVGRLGEWEFLDRDRLEDVRLRAAAGVGGGGVERGGGLAPGRGWGVAGRRMCVCKWREALSRSAWKSERLGKPEREGLPCLKVVAPNHPGALGETDSLADLHSFWLSRWYSFFFFF